MSIGGVLMLSFRPPPREEGLARTLANLVEGALIVAEPSRRSSTKPRMAHRYQYRLKASATWGHTNGLGWTKHAIMPL